MGKPAARITDMHICPASNGPVPHVGGPIVLGAPTVLIGGLPASRAGDKAICVGPPDTVVTGSGGVMISGKPAARMGDSCAHGGKVIIGCPTVLIGESAGGATGVTLGNPAAALIIFNGLANTRASGKVQQTYGNCGIESARQFMAAENIPSNEFDVLQGAVTNGNADYNVNTALVGGTSPQNRKKILDDNGVSSHLEDQNIQNISQAVSEGKGVITSHDAGKLWGNPNVNGGHAVTVTGAKYDSKGKISEFIINDTGTGNGAKSVPFNQFKNSLRPNRSINVTDNKIW